MDSFIQPIQAIQHWRYHKPSIFGESEKQRALEVRIACDNGVRRGGESKPGNAEKILGKRDRILLGSKFELKIRNLSRRFIVRMMFVLIYWVNLDYQHINGTMNNRWKSDSKSETEE